MASLGEPRIPSPLPASEEDRQVSFCRQDVDLDGWPQCLARDGGACQITLFSNTIQIGLSPSSSNCMPSRWREPGRARPPAAAAAG